MRTGLDVLNEVSERAHRVRESLQAKARRMTVEAGLSEDIMGIHLHNAMIDYQRGRPWSGVDYEKVVKAQELIRRSFVPDRLVNKWYFRQFKERGPDWMRQGYG